MQPIEMIRTINYVLSLMFVICYAYQFVYLAVPYVIRLKPHGPVKMHRYAVLISARNEQAVLPLLLKTIAGQDYPAELITTFVVADNCTDGTAAAARASGAVVYERFNKNQVGKGYALNFLLNRIRADYGDDAFDGYFVFDADNLLTENYITEMNKTFSDGYQIITSYRNSKNYGDNWISAGYALWFLREAKYLNHARMALGTSCAVSGTGFMFSGDILRQCGGWNFFLLTEDIQFTVHNIVHGNTVGYCPGAMLYDEQPVTFRQSWNQRLRWAKGYLQVFRSYGRSLLRGVFSKRGFACFDMTMTIMPAVIVTALCLVCNVTLTVFGIITAQNIAIALQSFAQLAFNCYWFMFAVGALTTISEWKKIHTSTFKKIFFAFTFPLFMFTYIPISVTALFKRVHWTPIEHRVAIGLDHVR